MSTNGAESSTARRHDYTDGASAIDISDAIRSNRRARQDSQYSQMYAEDGDGAMFSGPGHSVNPSSVSRMSHIRPARRSSEWSKSRGRSRDSFGAASRTSINRRDSGDSRASIDTHRSGEYDSSENEGGFERNKSLSPAPRTSVFSGLAHMFGRPTESSHPRRPSLSRRSTASSHRSRRSFAGSENALDTDDEDERWGYSSGEEGSVDLNEPLRDNVSVTGSMQYDSDPPSPQNGFLPILAPDPLFGDEARIDMDVPVERDDPPPPGPPSRQTIYITDEDTTIRFVGYETIIWRQWLWRVSCVLTFGVLGLLGHWIPRLWLRWVAQEKAFKDCKHGFVVVETVHHDITLFPVKTIDYPYPLATVFTTNNTDLGSRIKTNGNGVANDTLQTLSIVEYRYSKFALDVRSGLWAAIRNWRDDSWTQLPAVKDGLDPSTRKQRLSLFGSNEIDIKSKSTIALLVDEVIHPFYVFQIASIILWSLDSYYYYAFCIALISTFSVGSTLIETKKTIARMREMSRFSCVVTVFSEGIWIDKNSTELAPGDIINLSTLQASIVPGDLFLLSGDAIVNESMLTGESVPVSKVPIKDEHLDKWRTSTDVSYESAKGFLYAGTRIVRIRGTFTGDGGAGRPALALVARTGFDTTKGALVRSMLYPKPMGFKFYRDSMRFIAVLAGIAGLGFCASAVQFVHLGVKWHTILLRALDLITIVVPPALPATLSIGTSFAISRLRKLGIYCISPARVNVAGKVNVCCFDKTGTLTEDGLDILGVRGLDRHVNRFGELIEDVHDLPLGREKATFLHALATCHSLKMVDGSVIGDPLDVKMFEFTKWMLEEGKVGGTGNIKNKSGVVVEQTALVQTVVRPPGSAQFKLEDALKSSSRHAHFLELGVIRTFEFVSALRRMSVIVKRLRSTSMEVYVKGAPEVMSDICDKDSFPGDYDDLLAYYTKRGYRVIAIAGKSIDGLSWLKAQKMKREQAESGLRFLGLIIFENKVKPGTTPAIQALRNAHLACRMITGDNPLTAVSVARECSLINEAAHVFSPIFTNGGPDVPLSTLEWSSMDEFSWKLDPYTLKPMPSPHFLGEQDMEYQDYSLVVTGDVFRWMINHAPLETLQRMLVKTQIFARMSPDEKNEIVERLQALGYTVLMCGDGANDCAALKAADVGISLSEAEASVAAPFTSNTPDIACVLEVLKEGRAALVTSFSCFKYMALYSLIQFTTITLLYSFASSLGDFQFLYIDLFIIIPVAVTMGRTLPFQHLYHRRPTASLVSKKVLASIIGQIIITSAVQFVIFFWVRLQGWYEPPPPNDPSQGDQLEAQNFENTVLFLVSCFQYILVAAVFSIGPPYRQPMWTNGWLMASLIILTAFNLLVLLAPPQVVAVILELMPIPFPARVLLLGVTVMNIVMSVVYERWGAELISEIIGGVLDYQQGKRRIRDGKTYKAVEGGL